MAKKYRPQTFEKKWQERWKRAKLYSPIRDFVRGKKNYFLLTEFPYPSGNLHLGHWYAFSLPDSLARYERMKGKNVLYPIGFDAFGLPAENAAIKRKLNPRTWTEKNIQHMTKQLESMGGTFDWTRVVSTIDQNYYRWTQWMFLKMFEKKLAYRAETMVNWCPKDKTVLANEQVVAGKCERCETEVEQRKKEQWMFKITAYAEKLLQGLDKVDWPETTKIAQKNWIGKSEGSRIRFTLNVPEQGESHAVDVFTTRADTLYGATFLVVSPELSKKWLDSGWKASEGVKAYIHSSLKKRELERLSEGREKTGVDARITAIHPGTKKEIPVWVADYVLGSYGTGAVMAVPAHDQRDFEFAKKFNLPIKPVILLEIVNPYNPPKEGKQDTERKVIHAILRDPKTDSYLVGFLKDESWGDRKPINFVIGGVEEGEDWKESAAREIREETGYSDFRFVEELPFEVRAHFYQAQKDVNRRSHVRTFIFELNSKKHTTVPIEEILKHEFRWIPKAEVAEHLNVATDEMVWHYYTTGGFAHDTEGVLVNSGQFSGLASTSAAQKITEAVGGKREVTYRLRDWVLSRQRYWGVPIPVVHCKTCGYVPVREKDLPITLPKLSDYLPSDDGRSPLAKATSWVRVRCPRCKEWAERETDTMDTFVDSSWYYLRYTDPTNRKVFADKKKMRRWLPAPLYLGGAEHNTMHLLYSRFFAKVLHDLGYLEFDEPFLRRINRGIVLGPDGQKMAKSRGNVTDPDKEVQRYGADAVRMYLAFMAPYDQGGPWNPRGITGTYRFLARVYSLGIVLSNVQKKEIQKAKAHFERVGVLEQALHKGIKKVGGDIEALKFNTAVSALMILFNEIEKQANIAPSSAAYYFKIFLTILAPLAPHLSEELWRELGNKKSIHSESWPAYDPRKVEGDTVRLVIQINGRVRTTLEVTRGLAEGELERKVLELPEINKWIRGTKPARVIHVKNRLVNVVLDS